MLPVAPDQYMLSIYLVAYGKQGSVATSNVVNPYISKGSGTYVKVEAGYMKRALAFIKKREALAALGDEILTDIDGKSLFVPEASTLRTEFSLADRNGMPLIDNNEKSLIVDATRVLENTSGWVVIQEGYTKDANGTWRTNDIEYEVLVDSTGEIIVDENNEPIYVL